MTEPKALPRGVARLRLWLARLALVISVTAGLLVASLSAPVESWRTGERPAPALTLQPGSPPAGGTGRVWIDTDAACTAGGRTDSDDCLALLTLLRARGIDVVGISSVAGNAPLEVTHRTVQQLLGRLPAQVQIPPLFQGGTAEHSGSEAAGALRRALREGPLTLVALGPLSNVAAALDGHPELRRRMVRLVAVMGRRRGHLFHPSEGSGDGAFLGHGPVFTDFNVRQDPGAAQRVLAMHLPVVLVPYEAARAVRVDAADLDRLAAQGGAAAWVAANSRDWLRFWNDVVGLPGFYPFDLLAAAYLLVPERFHCARTRVWVGPAPDLFGGLYAPVSVIVGLAAERPSDVRVAGSLLYCPKVEPGVHDFLMQTLA